MKRENRFLLLLFITGFVSLSFEVALTRLFSFLLFQDFVFLAVSFAVLGIGLGAALSPRILSPNRAGFPMVVLGVYGVLLPATLLLILTAPSQKPELLWLLFGAASLPPFMLYGILAAFFYSAMPERSGALYAADLSGAALGTLMAAAGMNAFGPLHFIFVLSGMLLILQGWNSFQELRRGNKAGSLASVLLFLAFAALLTPLTGRRLDGLLFERTVPGKPLFDRVGKEGRAVERTRWNAVGRLDLLPSQDSFRKYLYTDGAVPANVVKFDGNLDSVAYMRRFVFYLPFSYGNYGKILSIGSGGGLDCLLGKLAGSNDITAVEINRELLSMVRDDSAFAGPVFDLPGVQVRVDEGRAFVHASREKYDLILFLLTQGNIAESGGRVLSDNYLMTCEAFREYFDHLNPGGRIVIAVHNPHRAARFLMTWTAMLREKGVDLPLAMRRFAMLASSDPAYRFLLLFHRDLPDASDMLRLQAAMERVRGCSAVFLPYLREEDKNLGGMARGTSTEADFIRTLPGGIPIVPSSDDKPFQNDLYPGLHPGLKFLLLVAFVFLAGVIACSIAFSKRESGRVRTAGWALYFAILGMGFMIAEVTAMHRMMLYLGYPILALVVVLFAMLLGSGLGGYCVQRRARRLPAFAFFILFALFAGYVPLLDAVMGSAGMLPMAPRCLTAFVLLFLPAFFMGMPFPSGLMLFSNRTSAGVPWMWAVNGAASVAGSVLAMSCSLLYGIRAAMAGAGVCYLIAGVLFLLRSEGVRKFLSR